MSRFINEMSRFLGTKERDGTRARDRESGHVPSHSRPVIPAIVPIYMSRLEA